MAKINISPDCRIAPAPVIIVSCANKDGKSNLITCAWAGNICSDPPQAYVSIRPTRFSHNLITESQEFAINLCSDDMLRAADLCGMKSGKDVDKWSLSGLTKEDASVIGCPIVKESPLSIECRVSQIIPLGSHDMFIGRIIAIDADEKYVNDAGKLNLDDAHLISLIHKSYIPLGLLAETMGYTVRKK